MCVGVWGVLWFCWMGVSEAGKTFHDIVGHEKVDRALLVIPEKVDAAEDLSVRIDGEVIMFFEAFDEMIGMGLADDFDSKVVNDKVEGGGTSNVAEKSRGVAGWNVAIIGKVLDQFYI